MAARRHPTPAHCIDCLADATHGVWYREGTARWVIVTGDYITKSAPCLYCKWHATVQAVQRNAAGRRARNIRERTRG